jgi:copper chaperone NosL
MEISHMTLNRPSHLLAALLACLAAALLSGCEPANNAKPLAPVEIDARTTCDLDGMLLADYPGPKAQIQYTGQPTPTFFCDTVELFHTLLAPEQVKPIAAVWVQDMGKADWEQPRGNWFDPKTGYFVLGSKRKGSMGPTIASFSQEADAKKFVEQYGGQLLRFGDIKPAMVDLSGGALHDTRM